MSAAPAPASRTGGAAMPTMPHDLDAERAVLGAAMWDPAAIQAAGDTGLRGAHMYHWAHQQVWHALATLAAQGQPTEPLALRTELGRRGEMAKLDKTQGTGWLAGLYSSAAVPTSVTYYARIIVQAATAREQIELATRITQLAEQPDHNPDQVRQLLRDHLDDYVHTATTGPATSWAPVDLSNVVAGGVLAEPPTILLRTDGNALLYSGKVHSVSGEPESGKTWLLLHAVAELVTNDHTVLYLDFEDSAESLVARLRALGCTPDHISAHLRYVRPDAALDDAGRAALAASLTQPVALAVVDGVTESMALHGLDPLSNSEYAAWFATLPRVLAAAGPAVAVIDHVPKDEERSKRYSIGAQHKLAVIDGAAYMVDIIRPFGVGQHGLSRIRVAKDKPGRVREHASGGNVGMLHMDSDGKHVLVTIHAPGAEADDAEAFQPTYLMERISRFVEISPGLSKAAIEGVVRGKATAKRLAIEMLIQQGYIRVQRGAHNTLHHTSIKPFREHEEADDETW